MDESLADALIYACENGKMDIFGASEIFPYRAGCGPHTIDTSEPYRMFCRATHGGIEHTKEEELCGETAVSRPHISQSISSI
jgi:hypothetical protein